MLRVVAGSNTKNKYPRTVNNRVHLKFRSLLFTFIMNLIEDSDFTTEDPPQHSIFGKIASINP